MSAALERERRATAGKRMGSLVGKAQEDDEAFWGHDTWAEDNEDNESFHESDEDSEARVDEFDPDFDESESDNEQEEAAAGMDEEMQLRRDERSQKRKQKFDIAKAGRDLMKKKKGKGAKRIMGEGFNSGLVLNFPGNNMGPPPLPAAAAALPVPPAPAPAATATATAQPLSPRKSVRLSPIRRNLRTATKDKTRQAEETRRKQQQSAAGSVSTETTAAPPKRKQRQLFTQEELLLEAATETEPENVRWLLGRKRVEDLANESQKTEKDVQGKIVSKFHSRRGCPNTLTFSDMDHVPDILARKAAPTKPKADANVCVITGKPARYRDPKTMMGYYDLEAFRELRRRLEAGEPLDQRKPRKEPEEEKKTAEDGKPAALPRQPQQPQAATQPATTGNKNPASNGTMPKPATTAPSNASAGSSDGMAQQKVAEAPPERKDSAGNVPLEQQQPAAPAPATTAATVSEAKRKTASSETPPARSSKRRKKPTPKAAIVAGSVPGVIASSNSSVQAAANDAAVPSRADAEPQSVSPETTTNDGSNNNNNNNTATHATLPALQQSTK